MIAEEFDVFALLRQEDGFEFFHLAQWREVGEVAATFQVQLANGAVRDRAQVADAGSADVELL
jgi:hypothetical protein